MANPDAPLGAAAAGPSTVLDVVEPPSPSAPSPQHEKKKFLRLFALADGVSHTSFAVYLLAAMMGICLFVFINASQGFVLSQILHLPSSTLGNATGTLTFSDELLSLPLVLLWGLLSDRVGRRTVYGLGFAFMSVGLALFTYARDLYPDLLLYRLVFAVGGAAGSSMMTAVLADYAADEDRGKVSGLVGLLSGVGALVALFGFLRVPAGFGDGERGLRVTYWIVAGVAGAFAGGLWVFLRGGVGHGAKDDVAERREEGPPVSPQRSENSLTSDTDRPLLSQTPAPDMQRKKSVWQLAKEGVLAARDSRILLGYAGSFLARGDTIILTLFLPLWVYKHYLDTDLCLPTPSSPSDPPFDPHDPDLKLHCRPAYLKSSALSGIAQTLALLGAPLFGTLSDTLYRPIPLLLSGLLGLLGYGLLVLPAITPTSAIAYIPMLMIGLAEIGVVVGSLALVTATAYVPRDVRGSVAGVSSFCGAVGILVNTKLSGVLFDGWSSRAPFVVMAVAHVLFVGVAGWVVGRDWWEARGHVRRRDEGVLGGDGHVDERTQDVPRDAAGSGPPASVMAIMKHRFNTRPMQKKQ
ncbi:major facilitator superfamily domain-containing protein [Fimicolochytrium jonesii]|uniref:major facilitator superfamily domain-containing protein n=1 Tax=Fimicolochytrium jonesii TaxID=1396493 RepID=UPI0022FEF183|nr:major facilitator superfamily domain-containing protein [Fimicolochytrium jonesii]KAI8821504.1 major facilitator superfamily domain-containing protein [Fimicolochytrium jonesii]